MFAAWVARGRFGLAALDVVAAAAADAATIFLDVRSDAEVAGTPLGRAFVHIPVTMSDTSQVDAKAAELLPDKAATILCFCGVGGRVMGAKAALEAQGYTSVLNAGGLKDLVAAGIDK